MPSSLLVRKFFFCWPCMLSFGWKVWYIRRYEVKICLFKIILVKVQFSRKNVSKCLGGFVRGLLTSRTIFLLNEMTCGSATLLEKKNNVSNGWKLSLWISEYSTLQILLLHISWFYGALPKLWWVYGPGQYCKVKLLAYQTMMVKQGYGGLMA